MFLRNDRKIKIDDCFIIHLERAVKRTSHVNYLKKNIPLRVSIIPAFDGKKPNTEMHNFYRPNTLYPKYPFKMRATEIATFLSHRCCWQKIIDGDLDGALIIEDDVKIDNNFFSYYFKKTLNEIKPGDFIRFPISDRESDTILFPLSRSKSIFNPVVIGLGMQAQIVTKDAAQNLLKITQSFDRPVDTYLQLKWIHNLKISSVLPSGISEISNSLGGTLIGNKKSLLEKIFREIVRPIYRLKIYYMSLLYKFKR